MDILWALLLIVLGLSAFYTMYMALLISALLQPDEKFREVWKAYWRGEWP